MPIYEYTCRACHHQFEFLLLPSSTVAPACPECASSDLEKAVSGFAVNSAELAQSRIKKARKQIAQNKNHIDKKVADAEHIREHMAEYLPPKE